MSDCSQSILVRHTFKPTIATLLFLRKKLPSWLSTGWVQEQMLIWFN